MNHLKLGYSIQKYWRELLTFTFATISAYVAFVYRDDPGVSFIFSILLTTVLLILTLYFILKEKDFYYLALDKYADKENWFGSGKFEFDKTNNAYVVADTDAGYIYAKTLLWKDYYLKLEFKILNKCLGVVVRANNLSNYVMLQIRKDAIRPHIRANGGWIPYETNVTGLTYEKDIKDGEWDLLEARVKGEDIEIIIRSKSSIVINKHWKIPSGKITVPIYDKSDEQRKNMTHIMDVVASYDYGSFGFRNGHGERALVKDLLVKNIN